MVFFGSTLLSPVQAKIPSRNCPVASSTCSTETRFLGVGKASRQLLAASAVGLHALVSRVQSDPHASQYHLQAFARCDQHVMRYAVVAGVSSFGLDSLMAVVLEDDRLCRQVGSLSDFMQQELSWVEGLPELCWNRLASMVDPKCMPQSLRHSVVMSMHIGYSYVFQKLLQPLSSPPWLLAHGDQDTELESLVSGKTVTVDDCSWKIKHLMEVGYDKDKLKQGLNLLLDVSWSTLSVEQAHGSAAVLHRFHPQYGCPFLASRTLVHQCRHLLGNTDEKKALLRQDRQLQQLQAKVPTRLSGRQLFFKALSSQFSKQAAGSSDVSRSNEFQQNLMKAHSRLYHMLPQQTMQEFEDEAKGTAAAKTQTIDDEISFLQEQRQLQKDRLAQHLRAHGLPNHTTSAKFVEDDWSALQDIFGESSVQGPRAFRESRDLCLVPPQEPAHIARDLFARQDTHDYKEFKADDRAPWIKPVCAHRDWFSGMVFSTADNDQMPAYLLLFCFQNPMIAHFLHLEPTDVYLPAYDKLTPQERFDTVSTHYKHTWRWTHLNYCTDAHLAGIPSEPWYVIADVVFGQHNLVMSDEPFLKLETVLEGFPKADRAQTAPKAKKAKLDEAQSTDLLQQHPWLSEYIKPNAKPTASRSSSSSHQAARPSLHSVDDDQLDQIWKDLADRQMDLQPRQDSAVFFETFVRGGKWTAENRGVAADCYMARSVRGPPTFWCKEKGYNQAASFSILKFGEEAASTLALEWARRMEFLYTEHLAVEAELQSSQEVNRYEEPPEFVEFCNNLPENHKAWPRIRALRLLTSSSSSTAAASSSATDC